ncbi:hypothetical protein [Phosphitispora fastidiosa]|uniref:hypothetical protein n=1 Tax=Phosphitispora fastidiosa TaxID=2837202 RepID=UPI001E340199|nr:hypothetical protein [Phosphitispora fastidiosa]MBU7006189.1 hypothetical protein [Phosphitispora fastidiosa]
MSLEDVKGQSIGAYVSYLKNLKFEELQALLQDILSKEKKAYAAEDIKLLEVLTHVDSVREFISNPGNILGNDETKHGEIAEQFDVLRRNCLRILDGLKADATFDNVGRTAPEDYIVAAHVVQSKFYNGINNTLNAVLKHNGKYEYFGSDGRSYYVIPKDQYEVIQKILNGDKTVDINGQPLRLSTIQKAKELIKLIEEKTNRPFNDVTHSSAFDYSEPQIGEAKQTLDKQETQYKEQSAENKKEIKKKADNDRQIAQEQAKPSFSEASKVAGIAAVFGGGISLGLSIYKKIKSGKKIEDFTARDWKEVGLDTGKGAVKGGVTGYSIYCLRNLYNIPAPIASAYTSAAFGILNVANKYRKGEIEVDDFMAMSQVVCFDSALSAVGAAVGQVIIPIPVLGAVIGSITTSVFSSVAKDVLNKQEIKLIEQYQHELEKKMQSLDEKYKAVYADIIERYKKLKGITNIAFDFELNNELRLQVSIDLAKEYGVEDSKVLKNCCEIDRYIGIVVSKD